MNTVLDRKRPRNVAAIIDETGDTKTKWDKDSPDEVEAARASFDRLKGKGYTFYRTDKKGEPAEIMHTFDPKAESMIAVPRIVAG